MAPRPPPPPSFTSFAADMNFRLFNLPQELFDEIYNHVFTAEPELIIDLDEDYKPPVQLQVHKSARAAFAKHYYGNTTFYVKGYHKFYYNFVHRWIKGLPYEHRLLIRQIKLDHCQHSTIWEGQFPAYKRHFFPATYRPNSGSMSPGMSAWQVQISYMDCEGDFPVIRFLPLGTRDDPPIQPGKEIATVPDYKSVTTTVRSGTGCPKVPTTVRGAENATDAWKVEASPPANSKSVAPKGTVVASSTLLPSSATTEEGLPRCTKAGSHFNVTKNISAALFSAIGYAQLSIGSMFEQKPSRQQQTILPLFRHASIKEW